MVVWPRFGGLFVSQNSRRVCVCHSLGKILGCAYTICTYVQTSFSYTIPSGSSCPLSRAKLFSCKFAAFAYYGLIVLSLSPQNLHLLFCCVLSILALIWIFLMALFCAAIRRNSVSLLTSVLFLTTLSFSLVCEMSFVSHFKRPHSCYHYCYYLLLDIFRISVS